MNDVICDAKGLKKYFPIMGGILQRVTDNVHAVDGIDIKIGKKETMGLVGESGCGKTTMGKCLMGTLKPMEGKVLFMDRDIYDSNKEELKNLRKNIGVIFQDPFTSLDPRWTISDIIKEPLTIHGIGNRREKRERVDKLLQVVGISLALTNRYPHELSGGQRQRVAIARALSCNPKFIIADEPVSSLDTSLKGGILNLMKSLQDQQDLSILFISHDLSVVKHMSHKISVMYRGKIVEVAPTERLFDKPQHPYTKALISAIPIPDPTFERHRIILSGDVPSLINPQPGCRFQSRCWLSTPQCKDVDPKMVQVEKEHFVACQLMN